MSYLNTNRQVLLTADGEENSAPVGLKDKVSKVIFQQNA
jgi:hypothetical protein